MLDTNFLLIPGQFKVDIVNEINKICHFPYTLHILDVTKAELENIIAKQSGKARQVAKLAFQLVERCHFGIIKTETYKKADQALLDFADKSWVVATQDKALKQKLREKGIACIILRQKKYLQLVE